jgi:hypothetical protein
MFDREQPGRNEPRFAARCQQRQSAQGDPEPESVSRLARNTRKSEQDRDNIPERDLVSVKRGRKEIKAFKR